MELLKQPNSPIRSTDHILVNLLGDTVAMLRIPYRLHRITIQKHTTTYHRQIVNRKRKNIYLQVTFIKGSKRSGGSQSTQCINREF